MTLSKFSKLMLAIVLFSFYFYIAVNAGFVGAMALFIKTLGIVIFGLAHIWVLQMFQFFGEVLGRKSWSFTSLLAYFRRLVSYFYSPSLIFKK